MDERPGPPKPPNPKCPECGGGYVDGMGVGCTIVHRQGCKRTAEPRSPLMDEPTPTDEPMTVAELEALGLDHVGRFAAHGHDGRGWLGNTDVFVRAEDYENHVNYTDDGFRIYAGNARLEALIAALGERDEALRLLREWVTHARSLCDCEVCAFLAAHPVAPPVEAADCESCGSLAAVTLGDGSSWCLACHAAALNLGYDDDLGTLIRPCPHGVNAGFGCNSCSVEAGMRVVVEAPSGDEGPVGQS